MTEFILEPKSELRFALANRERSIKVTMVSGSAEVFGTELAQGHEYCFCGQRGAIFTWYGCTLKVSGATAREVYVAKDTPMSEYVNIHGQIESAREDAVAFSAEGPRVLICGSTDSGKSSLCRLLLSYAVRLDRSPIFVDLDVGQGELTIPGVVSASPLDKGCLTVEGGCSMSIPLAYFFGHVSPSKNIPVYKGLIERLAGCVNRRLEKNSAERAAGIVVNTCGWVDGEGYSLLLHACKTLACDVVLVLGHDRLFNSLQTDLSAMEGMEQTNVLKLSRSGGVVERSTSTRIESRRQRIRQYFYGCAAHREGSLQPATLHVGFEDVKIFEIGEALRLAKEMTTQASADSGVASLTSYRLTKRTPERNLMHTILAVTNAKTKDELLKTNIAGFAYISGIDEEKKIITMMVPCAGKLPGEFLLMGGLKWLEH
eukprot:g4059.t1